MLLEELKKTLEVKPIIDQLRSDLADIGIEDPSFTGGFCFHAAFRIFNALKSKFPEHELVIIHDGGHVAVYDYNTNLSYDATGSGKGEGHHMTRPPIHTWKTSKGFLSFLRRNERNLGADSAAGLQVLK